tara:strand:+ start:2019 stop:2261 length:243 start_codon:yes stop_codon:yes gene_type:complete
MKVSRLLELNEDRRMKKAKTEDLHGTVTVSDTLACLDTYTFIRQKEEGFYLLNVDPLSEEITSILVKSEFLSADVQAIFK